MVAMVKEIINLSNTYAISKTPPKFKAVSRRLQLCNLRGDELLVADVYTARMEMKRLISPSVCVLLSVAFLTVVGI